MLSQTEPVNGEALGDIGSQAVHEQIAKYLLPNGSLVNISSRIEESIRRQGHSPTDGGHRSRPVLVNHETGGHTRVLARESQRGRQIKRTAKTDLDGPVHADFNFRTKA